MSDPTKNADTAFPVLEPISARWSPYVYSDAPFDRGVLGSLFEAARWAPSCFNEQPWRFFVATRDETDAWERLAGLLVEGNSWAKQAHCLGLSVAKTRFDRNAKENPHAWHDVGLAMGQLIVQAQSMGLYVHQMAGFDAGRATAELSIPDGFAPVVMWAIGSHGERGSADEKLAQRDAAPRARTPLDELVFRGSFGDAASL